MCLSRGDNGLELSNQNSRDVPRLQIDRLDPLLQSIRNMISSCTITCPLQCCTSNEHCAGPSVCNDFGFCTQCLSEQEACRRDDDCCSQLICSAARCRLPKTPGQPGARCNRHQDCNRGLCCAKDKYSEGLYMYISLGVMPINCFLIQTRLQTAW